MKKPMKKTSQILNSEQSPVDKMTDKPTFVKKLKKGGGLKAMLMKKKLA